MALNKSKGGVWAIKMTKTVKWAGVKAGDIVPVPNKITDAIALRWIDNGQAEFYVEPAKAENKMAKRAKGSKLVRAD